jgi:hypothetical protein
VLTITAMAVVFAPGQLPGDRVQESTPQEVTAAVLAPTTGTTATTAVVRSRSEDRELVIVAFAALLLGPVVVLLGRRRPGVGPDAVPQPSLLLRAPRRGPPVLAV